MFNADSAESSGNHAATGGYGGRGIRASQSLGARVSPATARRFQQCRILARTLDGNATVDRMLRRGLGNLLYNFKRECQRRGIDYAAILREAGCAPDPESFKGIDDPPPLVSE